MPLPSVRVSWRVSYRDALPVGGRKQGVCGSVWLLAGRVLDARYVEENGRERVAEEDAEDDDDTQDDVVE